MADLWTTEGFDAAFESWQQLENPPTEVAITVLLWLMGRRETPYLDVSREPNFENLWYGRIPGSLHGDGLVATCSYFIKELDHKLVCSSIASLRLPA